MADLRLGKSERIYLRDEIEALFSSKSGFMAYPVRVLMTESASVPGSPRIKMLISVPKKRLRHAVDRNRIKRLFREVFRLQKSLLQEAVPEERGVSVAMIYVSDEVCTYADAEKSLHKILKKLTEKYRKEESDS